MTSPNNTTNITPPRVPLIDERTGLISREWYRFFLNLFTLTGSGTNQTSLVDLQLGPPSPQQEDIIDIVIDVETAKIQPTQESATEQIAELQKQIEALQSTPQYLVNQANSVVNPLTFNSSGSGAASGATFDGSSAVTVSYNTIGAPSTTGTNASGTWGISITGSAASTTTATNATNFGVTDDTSTNADYYPVWVTSNTGNLPARVTSTKLKFNPSSGVMTVTGGVGGGTF
jgi:hypothetical protein